VLVSGGTLALAFIPVLSEMLEKNGRPAAWDIFSRIANLVFLVAAGLSIIIALLADVLVRSVVTPGFSLEQQQLVADLMRLNLISTLIFSVSGLVMSGLQANQHFLLPAIAPSMFDLGMLFGVIILAPETGYQIGPLQLPAFGLGIHALVYGGILGAVLYLGIQVPGLLRYGFRWTPRINLRHPGVLQVLRLLGPRLVTVGFIQVVFILQDNFASWLVEGSVSALVYGWLFMQVPETIIGTAIATVLLPTISELVARDDTEGFREALNKAIRVILALTIPIAAIISTGLRPLVELLGFDAAAADLVVWTGRAYMIGMIGHALLEIAARGFYARQDAIRPMLLSGLATLIFAGLAWGLARPLGAPGIALANSIAFTTEGLVLWWLHHRRMPGVLKTGGTLLRALPAALLGALVVYAVLQLPLAVPEVVLGLGGLLLGGLVALPFVWREVRLLAKF
jgi:putative peptidoglycan lipid II flippase